MQLGARKKTSAAAAHADRGKCGTGQESELGFSNTETVEMPLNVGLSFSAEQFARYEALVAKLQQRGPRVKKVELILAALENLLNNSEPRATRSGGGTERRRPIAGPSYQVHIQHCPRCAASTVSTSRGDRPIDRATLQSALCDAKLHPEEPRDERGESCKRSRKKGRRKERDKNREKDRPKRPRTLSTTPPGLRLEVLERDRLRCRMPGCRNRQFLQVHHIVAKEDGGKHRAENLITLCGACHRALHALGAAQRRKVLQREGLRRASHRLE
jgi:5-methylcytosine-specific restriction endonuclease McrA